jgi:hypothetical protein
MINVPLGAHMGILGTFSSNKTVDVEAENLTRVKSIYSHITLLSASKSVSSIILPQTSSGSSGGYKQMTLYYHKYLNPAKPTLPFPVLSLLSPRL